MTTILQKDNLILRSIAKIVPKELIKSAKIKDVVKKMEDALKSQEDGVAIAAPQIGELWRIFMISSRIFDFLKEEEEHSGRRKSENRLDEENSAIKTDLVFINPEIVRNSKKKRWVEEGCLSARYLYGKVLRSEKTTVRALNQGGKLFEYGGSGIISQIFQHEIDHLDGKLFIDKAKEIHEVLPRELKDYSAGAEKETEKIRRF